MCRGKRRKIESRHFFTKVCYVLGIWHKNFILGHCTTLTTGSLDQLNSSEEDNEPRRKVHYLKEICYDLHIWPRDMIQGHYKLSKTLLMLSVNRIGHKRKNIGSGQGFFTELELPWPLTQKLCSRSQQTLYPLVPCWWNVIQIGQRGENIYSRQIFYK